MTVVELRDVTPAVDRELAGALLEVQHAAYAVEAGLIGDPRIPPLRENLEDLQNAPLQWLAAFADGAPVGAVAWSEGRCEVDIDRLLVAPSAHRRGGWGPRSSGLFSSERAVAVPRSPPDGTTRRPETSMNGLASAAPARRR